LGFGWILPDISSISIAYTIEATRGFLKYLPMRATERINNLFGSAPFRLPELIRGLVDSFWIGQKIKVTTTVSPFSIEGISFTNNMIIVGGTPKNLARVYYLKTGLPYLLFSGELVEHADELAEHEQTTNSDPETKL